MNLQRGAYLFVGGLSTGNAGWSLAAHEFGVAAFWSALGAFLLLAGTFLPEGLEEKNGKRLK